ncbi:MAG TPA: alpha-rhamnosidase, partial [Porphyromonadaceae bacterium]|nr:alpha-rhamnosidase [Porphyromonadaceae bacterium]
MNQKVILLSLLLVWLTGCTTNVGTGSVRFTDLQTEMRENPEGLGVEKPRFSWKFTSDKPDVMQKAYRIEVAASENELKSGSGLLWNSGRVDSDQSVLVEYAGKPLESGKKYFWRVTVWTNRDETAQSDIRYWSAALLKDSDWKAQWIGLNDTANLKVEDNRTILPARYLRKEFDAVSKPRRAVLYVSGVGSSVCYINGNTVGDDVFGPLPTWYDASVPYLTYDITSFIKKGANAIGVALGNGRYLTMREKGMFGFGLPRLIAQLDIEYENGEHDIIVSDGTWMAS